MADIPSPPPGFTLDSPSSSVPPPPAGFTLDSESAPPVAAAATPEGDGLLSQIGKSLENYAIKGPMAAANLVYGVGKILPGSLGERSAELQKSANAYFQSKLNPEASANVPGLGTVSPSDVMQALPYAMLSPAIAAGATAAGAGPIAATVAGESVLPAQLTAEVAAAKTPEERQAAIDAATKNMAAVLAFHGMHAGFKAIADRMTATPKPAAETVVDFTPEGGPVVQKANGDVVAELPAPDPVMAEAADHMLARKAGVEPGDLEGFAKWFSDEYLNGKPVSVEANKKLVSETVDSPDSIRVSLSDRDSNIEGLWHELSQHAATEDGMTLTGGSVPHDNTTIAADVVANEARPPETPEKIAVFAGSGINRPENASNALFNRIRGISAVDPETGTKVYENVSARLAARENTSQKLEQLMAINEEAARAARAKPSARNAAIVELGEPLKKIADALGGVQQADEFITAINGSRLIGIRDFWNKIADDVKTIPEEKFQANVANYRDLVNDKLDTLKIDGSPASDMISPSMWTAKDTQPLRQRLSEIFKTASSNVGQASIGKYGTDLAAYEKGTPNLDAAKQIYKDEIEPRLNAIQEARRGPFSENLGPWGMFAPLSAIDENGDLIHPKSGFRGGLAEPGNPHGNMATGQFTYSGKARDLVDAYARMKTSAAKANMLETFRAGRIGVTGDQPPSFIQPPGSPRALTVDPVPIQMLDGSKMWLPQAVSKWVRPILDSTYLDAAQPEAGVIGRALNAIQMGGPVDLLIHNATMFWKIASLPADTGSGLWQAGRAPFLGRFVKMFEPFFNNEVVDPSTDRGGKVFDFMVKGGQLPARYATVTTDPQFAALTGAELKKPTLAKPLSLEALTFGPHGTDYRARAIATAAYMNENPFGKPSDPAYVHFMERFGVYRKELLGDYLQRAKSSGLAPFATAFASGLKAGKSAVLLGGEMPTPAGQLSPQALSMRAEHLFQSGATGAVLGWFGIHKLLTGNWLPAKGTPLMMVPLDQMKKDVADHLPKGVLWGDKAGRRFLDISTLYPIEARGFRAYGVKGAFDTLNANGTAGQAAEAALRDTLNSRLQIAGPAPRFATRLAGRDLYLSPLRDIKGKPQVALTQSAPTARPGLPQLAENAKSAVAGSNPLSERAFRESESGYGGTFADRVTRMVMGFVGIRPGYLQRGRTTPAMRNIMQQINLPRTVLMDEFYRSH